VQHDATDTALWLTFWVVFAVLMFSEHLLDRIVLWIPCASLLYVETKFVVLLVLLHPLVQKALYSFLCSIGFVWRQLF